MTDRELHGLALKYGSLSLKYRKKFLGLLPEINNRQLYLRYGFHSIYEYAAKVAGVSNNLVNEILRLEKKLEDKPKLHKALISGKIGWSKLKKVSRLPGKEQDLLQIALTNSKAAIETLSRDIKSGPGTVPPRLQGENRPNLETFRAKLTQKTLDDLRVLKLELEKEQRKPLSWNQAIKLIVNKAKKHVLKPRKAKPITKVTRHIPIHIKRRLPKICSHPNCHKPAQVIHHPHRFSHKPNHKNLRPLCKAHHELVHSGHIANETKELSCWETTLKPQSLTLADKKFLSYRQKALL